MISIIVVYNDSNVLNGILLKSLKRQTREYELLLIDNTNHEFSSAARALNSAAVGARGKYLMFVHQDVELDDPAWLEDAEGILDRIEDLGIAGVVGMGKSGQGFKGKYVGHISDGGTIRSWCKKRYAPVKVQTLDECLLIIPRKVFLAEQFDETGFDGWHCYGIDYCLRVKKYELSPYVIPKFVYHRSNSTNSKNLFEYQLKLYNKHKNSSRSIYTTCGEISIFKLPILYLKSKIVNVSLIKPLYHYLKNRPVLLD